MSEKFSNLSLDVVGFSASELAKFRRYIKEPYGIGAGHRPTGSGKTHHALRGVERDLRTTKTKIIHYRDPVEYQIRGITQIPVNEKKGLTFARGLPVHPAPRPDKILVGEIPRSGNRSNRHQCRAHRTLVFTTVHANNVLDVLGRF